MAIEMARRLRDGELAIMGAVSLIPQCACRMAQLSTAPSLSWIVGGSGAVRPQGLSISSCDQRLIGSAVTSLPLPEVILLEGRGDAIDVFFAGGLQIDVHGNCNLTAVGDWTKPRLRGPGGVGLPFLPRAGRVFIYTTSHNRRTFVEHADFVSGPGFVSGPEQWRGKSWPGSGPALVVTPLATMDFDPDSLRMRLVSVHGGVEMEQVLEATGFELEGVASASVTPPPTQDELAALDAADPDHLLRDLP